MTRSCFYVTTPIYYVNDRPHIGHAYTSLAADVLARFMRLDGREVVFLTGTDEHGQKVEKAARAKGVDPQSFCDEVSESFRALSRLMNYSNDDFIRTTEARHTESVQALWTKLADAGQIYLDKYAGWYSVHDESYYAEEECVERDGQRLSPSGSPVEWIEEPSYFFRLSAWQDALLDLYESRPDFVLPKTRRNEVVSFVRSGLRDLSISRTSFRWGVPVPGDPDHVIWVWLDALPNYITALGYPDVEGERFQRFWPALHLVGKDILRFHAVYWPAFLIAAGIEPPFRVFAHGWWTVEGAKMSKSLGNFIAPDELVERYGLDATRYFLMRELPFGNDGNFSHEAMVRRMNAELANDFGNLAQRVLSMIHKNCAGRVPEPGSFSDDDRALLAAPRGALERMRAALENQAMHRALDALWSVIGEANRYTNSQAPWKLKQHDPARMRTVLYVLAETLRGAAILTQPTLPDAAARMLDQLAIADSDRSFASLEETGALVHGTELPEPVAVFPRYLEPS